MVRFLAVFSTLRRLLIFKFYGQLGVILWKLEHSINHLAEGIRENSGSMKIILGGGILVSYNLNMTVEFEEISYGK